jgi:hypothetical protein
MIPILPETAWREFRSAPKVRGQNQTIHQALIIDASGQEHKCFVKASPAHYPMPLAEGLAWLALDALGLPRPKFAALLILPIHKLRACMPMDQHWSGIQHALAFCSSTVEGKHITSAWQWLARVRAAKAFTREDIAKIAAFDMWVENQDRHAANFIRDKAGTYVPIDNELILYTLLWVSMGFGYEHRSLKAQAQALLKPAGYAKFEVSMMLASKDHHPAFLKVSPALQQLVQTLVRDPIRATQTTTAILQFLGQRAQPDWLANELGLIT